MYLTLPRLAAHLLNCSAQAAVFKALFCRVPRRLPRPDGEMRHIIKTNTPVTLRLYRVCVMFAPTSDYTPERRALKWLPTDGIVTRSEPPSPTTEVLQGASETSARQSIPIAMLPAGQGLRGSRYRGIVAIRGRSGDGHRRLRDAGRRLGDAGWRLGDAGRRLGDAGRRLGDARGSSLGALRRGREEGRAIWCGHLCICAENVDLMMEAFKRCISPTLPFCYSLVTWVACGEQ
jgi:hypothetical protein